MTRFLALGVPAQAVALADVIRRLRGKLVRRHANDEALGSGVHHAAKPPEVFAQEEPATLAGLRDTEGIKRKADVNEVKPVLLVTRRRRAAAPASAPRLAPPPPALKVVEKRTQSIHLGVHARCRPPAEAVEPPGDHLPPAGHYRQVVVPCGLVAHCLIFRSVFAVGPLFRPAPTPSA